MITTSSPLNKVTAIHIPSQKLLSSTFNPFKVMATLRHGKRTLAGLDDTSASAPFYLSVISFSISSAANSWVLVEDLRHCNIRLNWGVTAIAPEDQSKTTFTCPFGTFAFRRMSFGLCNAPRTFQRCMLSIFLDMVGDFIEKVALCRGEVSPDSCSLSTGDETPPFTPTGGASSLSRTHDPGTPPESSRGLNMSLDPFSHLPDDGCPFTELTRGARWNNQDCCFPNGPKKQVFSICITICQIQLELTCMIVLIGYILRRLVVRGWSCAHHDTQIEESVASLDKGEDKSLFDFFKRAKLNAKGAYVDKKSEDIAAAVESRIVDQDLTVEAINKIFLEVNSPDDKGFIYGLGSLGVALSAPASSSSHGSRSSRLSEERLRVELAKRDAEYLKLQEEQRLLAEQMQKDKDEMAARFAAQQQQVEELFRQMEERLTKIATNRGRFSDE
ncbi:hypothetical protein OROHE_002746 [Orobanche hederae]